VIVGPSDNGKSAIFRAICWVLYNRPLGEAFRSYWAEKTKVTTLFTTPDGTTKKIVREKGKKFNGYRLDGLDMQAVGSGVPDQVLKAHGMDQELNVQSQIDPFFLIQSSSGEVAKYFNRVAQLEDIDVVTKHIDFHAKASRAKTAQAQEATERYQQQLERYTTLPDIQRLLLKGEGMKSAQDNLQTQVRGLIQVLAEVSRTQSRLEQLAGVERITNWMKELAGLVTAGEELQGQVEELETLCFEIGVFEREVQEGQQQLKVLPLVNKALKEQKENKELRKTWSELDQEVGVYRNIETNIQTRIERAQDLQVLFTQEMGEQCALCGQKIGGK